MEHQSSENYKDLISWWKNLLSNRVDNIETVEDLGSSPVSLSDKTLKISISHPAIKELRLKVLNNIQISLAEDLGLLYYETAVLENGSILDNIKEHVARIHRVLNTSKPNKDIKVAKFVKSEDAEVLNIEGGETCTILLEAKDTNGIISVFDSILPKGNFAPNHMHEIDAELFYVIKGEIEFEIDGNKIIGKEGDCAIAGQFVPRAFKALTDSRLLVFNVPGGPSEHQMRHLALLKAGEIPSQEWIEKIPTVFKMHILK
jgi:quercetin dioxygenase-like cupin family protein